MLFTKQKKSKKSKEKYICKVTLPLYELRVNINIFSIQIPKKKKKTDDGNGELHSMETTPVC